MNKFKINEVTEQIKQTANYDERIQLEIKL